MGNQKLTLALHVTNSGIRYLVDPCGRIIATLHSLEDGIDNPARIIEAGEIESEIVRAVNSFDALVTALRDALIGVETAYLAAANGVDSAEAFQRLERCRAALKLAEGDQVVPFAVDPSANLAGVCPKTGGEHDYDEQTGSCYCGDVWSEGKETASQV